MTPGFSKYAPNQKNLKVVNLQAADIRFFSAPKQNRKAHVVHTWNSILRASEGVNFFAPPNRRGHLKRGNKWDTPRVCPVCSVVRLCVGRATGQKSRPRWVPITMWTIRFYWASEHHPPPLPLFPPPARFHSSRHVVICEPRLMGYNEEKNNPSRQSFVHNSTQWARTEILTPPSDTVRRDLFNGRGFSSIGCKQKPIARAQS